VVCPALGPLESLRVQEMADPKPGPGEAVITVEAAGANFVDGLMAQGRYQVQPPVPYVPGGEVVGVVDELGPDTTELALGNRVLCLIGFGGFAERAVVRQATAVQVPPDIDTDVAATFTQAYSTAWFALAYRAGLQPGEKALVLGAGGGIGLAATDVARALGASVVAVGSSSAKRRAALGAGASTALDSAPLEDLKDRVRQVSGGGVDVVIDPVGGALGELSLHTLVVHGRYLVVGFASGSIPQLPLNQVLLRNRSVIGVDWGAWAFGHPTEQRRLLEALLAMASDGRLRPATPARAPLDEAASVLQSFLDRRSVGKIAIVP
jgi:NADPH:quinone reductase